MTNPGRNDPCHCGSGKKYKKCHLEADKGHRARMLEPVAAAETPSSFVDVKALPSLLRRLSEMGSDADRAEFSKLLGTSQQLLEYLACHEEIEAARAELETHRAAFEELARNGARYSDLARAVFEEECFAPFRFTSSDIRRAFDHVGYPALMSTDDDAFDTLRAAILHLADKKRRSTLSMGVLSRLSQFVRAGRFMEGWIVLCAAMDTAENLDGSNAFLFHMFSHGYNVWVSEKRANEEALFRAMGFDLGHLREMTPVEQDSWIQSLTSDPAKQDALEALFRDHPHLRKESVANLDAIVRNSVKLLQREDSRFLQLSIEETQPWVALFNERFNQSRFHSEPAEDDVSGEWLQTTFAELAAPLMREMARAIFTRDRILELITVLKKYRIDLLTAGDREAANYATGAITYLRREDSPGENSFLLTLCWQSTNSAIKEVTPAEDPPAD